MIDDRYCFSVGSVAGSDVPETFACFVVLKNGKKRTPVLGIIRHLDSQFI